MDHRSAENFCVEHLGFIQIAEGERKVVDTCNLHSESPQKPRLKEFLIRLFSIGKSRAGQERDATYQVPTTRVAFLLFKNANEDKKVSTPVL